MSTKLKKVISFSLYGHNDFYCLGLLENIDIINDKYKDWEIYVFYNNIPDEILYVLKNKQNTYLYECISKGYTWEGMFWRFYPMQIKNIDIFLSRDADSRITDREMNLVNIWINSDKVFHIIRDHPYHNIDILGGMFGVKNKVFSNKKIVIDNFISKYYLQFKQSQEKGPDQVFLCTYIYPMIKNNNMTHISYESLRKSPNDILIDPNPTNFIGMPMPISPSKKYNCAVKSPNNLLIDTISSSKLLHKLGVKYETDKTDKNHTFKEQSYCDIYDKYFINIRKNVKTFIEIGIRNGCSLKMWKEYFPNATIYGIDIDPVCKKYEEERIKCFIGDQNDEKFLREIKDIIGEYDILLDDGSHINSHQIKTFNILYENCNKNGFYIIEDLRNSYEEVLNVHNIREIWPGMKYNDKNDQLQNYRKDLNDFFQDKIKKLDFYTSDKMFSIHHYPMIVIFENK